MGHNRGWVGTIEFGMVIVMTMTIMGCSVDVTAEVPPPEADTERPQTMSDIVTIIFRNQTADDAVDVEFHTTNDPLEIVPADLFDPENGYQMLRNIGVGGGGRLPPEHEDTIELDCASGLTIGTRGGTFVDNETGDVRGSGVTRWLQEGAQFSCGDLVVFEFLRDGDEFRTELLLGRDSSRP